MRHLIDITDLTPDELDRVLGLGLRMAQNPREFARQAEGRILAALFFEPSTRTRLSFESAMLSLGGTALGFSDSAATSTTKGESLADTARTVSCYSDIIAMRHPQEGAAMLAAQSATVPVINAGDGGHAHPTQTLTDLLTLLREKGTIGGLRFGLCGDLKYGRTVHSLIHALGYFPNVDITLISPPELALPDYMKTGALAAGGITWRETDSLDRALPGIDVLYMTRIQRERFDDPHAYAKLKGSYVLDAAKMALMRGDAVVLHPLPRVDEISPQVDSDPRAAYFRQVESGRYVRMALIEALLSGMLADRPLFDPAAARHDLACRNPKCVAAPPHEAPPVALPHGDGWKCLYCEQTL